MILALAFLATLLSLSMKLALRGFLTIPLLSRLFLSLYVTTLYFIVLVCMIIQLVTLVMTLPLMWSLEGLLSLFHVKHLFKRRMILLRNKLSGVSDPHSFLSCPGERIHILYDSRFDGSRVVLEESGSFDMQERINSYAPYTDLSYMLNRLKVGDNSVLSNRAPMYGDFSGLPDNPTDAINLYHGAESVFAQLPAEEKLAYNNDFRVWLSSLMAGCSSAERSVSDSVPIVDDKKVEDVVNEP